MNNFSKERFKKGEEYSRALFFLSPFIFLFSISLFQVLNLTLFQGDKYQTIAESNRIYQKPISPVRGFIYDRNGTLLAENIVQRDLYVTPAYIEDYAKTILTLSNLLDMPYELLEKNFSKGLKKTKKFYSFPLVKALNEEQIAKAKVNLDSISGIEVKATLKRYVLHEETLAHVLGYVGDISSADIRRDKLLAGIQNTQIGKTGIEKEFDFILRGKSGITIGNLFSMMTILKGLPLSYFKDLQDDKSLVFDSYDTLKDTLLMANELILNLNANKINMLFMANQGYTTATDFADYLVKNKNLSFRESYAISAKLVNYAEKNKKMLSELNLEEIKKFYKDLDKSVLKVFDVKNSMNMKKSHGGTSVINVKSMIKKYKREI